MAIGRSENMMRIRSKDTLPELLVRRQLRALGYRGYRLHRADLPGNPDIAFIGRKKAILVHGCFWHGHECKEGARKPKSRQDYWLPKIERNRARDAENQTRLVKDGWLVLTLWECELGDLGELEQRLRAFMSE